MERNPEYEQIYAQQEEYRKLRERIQQHKEAQRQLYQQGHIQNMNYPYQYRPSKTTNGLAIASLICSLGTLVIPIGFLPGIILGFIGLYQINNEPERYDGKGLAIAGIAIGFAFLLIIGIYFIFYFMMIFTYGY